MPTGQTTSSISSKSVQNEIYTSGPGQQKRSQDDGKVAIEDPTMQTTQHLCQKHRQWKQ
jgi:hypothetical protein